MFRGIAGEEHRVALTLYTDAFVIRGQLATRQRRVSDSLNQAENSFIVLTDVTLDEYGSRTVASRSEFAQVNLVAVPRLRQMDVPAADAAEGQLQPPGVAGRHRATVVRRAERDRLLADGARPELRHRPSPSLVRSEVVKRGGSNRRLPESSVDDCGPEW